MPKTIQDAVLGEVLPTLGRRHQGMRGDPVQKAILYKLGTQGHRSVRAMAANAQRVPQSVVKRVRAGGTHSAKELTRQLDYITRDEAVQATWMNQNGIERGLHENTVKTVVPQWTSGWAGNPKRGHTDHIILSFPKGTDIEAAEQISREWGRAVFGSGDFGDSWRYVAALHANTEHVHAHFVVDKRGIEDGKFLSISMKSDLNYDVMRELHAKIAGDHGVSLNASSRRSRGIVENAPREISYRIAHEAQRQAGGAGEGDAPKVEVPPMSMVERMKREASIRGFARQYRTLGRLAALSQRDAGPSDFMSKMFDLFGRASETLEEGVSLVATSDVNTPTIDPSDRILRAQQQMFDNMRETWDEIQAMESGAERVQLEQQFAEQTRNMRELAISDPFLHQHGDRLEAERDPYHLSLVDELNSLHANSSGQPETAMQVEAALQDLRERLIENFAESEDELRAAGTSAEEMAERFMLSDRTAGQIDAWEEGGWDRDAFARDLVEEFRNDIAADADRDAAEVDWQAEHEKAASFGDGTKRLEHVAGNRALFEDLSERAATIIDDYEVPRDMQEVIARDQLLQAEKYHRLADVPAIERIVDRLEETLSEKDLEAVREGDYTVLREEIKDPAIRAAVGSELRNEGDVSDDVQRHSEPVEQFQQLARQTNSLGVDREKTVTHDLSDDYEL